MDISRINQNAVVAAAGAAEEAWRAGGLQPTPVALVAVRISPSGKAELYTTVETTESVFFFAGASPPQVYAVAGFKCATEVATAGGVKKPFLVVVDSDDDRALGKSPLAPVGCTLSELNTAMTKRRIYAAERVAKDAAKAARDAGGVIR